MSAVARFSAAAAILLAATVAASHAQADTRLVGGAQLVFSDTLSDNVVIATDSTLHGQIRLTREEGSGLACLTVVSGYSTVISTSRCDPDVEHMRIDVPADMDVTVAATGEGDIHMADLGGRLVATLSGSGDLVAGHVAGLVAITRSNGDITVGQVDGPATVETGASGDVRIRALHGPLTAKLRGSGDLVVGAAEADGMVLDITGSGDAYVGPGHIASLRANLLGTGDLSVAAVIHDAAVDARGGGDVKIAPVSGTLTRNTAGDSDLVILGPAEVRHVEDVVARKFGRTGSSSVITTFTSKPGASLVEHLLTLAFVVLAAIICWRIVRRAGGFGGLRRPGGQPAAPSHPGVLALGETMARLEGRLGRLESYVTTREFDLARKFRELGQQ